MSLKLYGSLTSPYVRRIRMAMYDLEHEFEIVNIYDDQTRKEFTRITPIRKLPVLVANNEAIFDSHVIYQYLSEHHDLPALNLHQHNLLSVTDAVLDSLIILFMGKRSDLPVDDSKLLFKLQMERLPHNLEWLNQHTDDFKQWHMPSMSLVSLLDWAEFRDLHSFEDYPALLQARAEHQQRPSVVNTLPQE